MVKTIGIVGAGISALACARKLSDAGHKVTLFEKSRGIGGRISTRQTREGLRFDHGAQYATAKSDLFSDYLESCIQQGAAATWQIPDTISNDNKQRSVGTPDMKSLIAPLAAGLDICFETTITSIMRHEDGWQLESDTQPLANVDIVVCTAPAPQTQKLAQGMPEILTPLSKAVMAPCWALMVAFDTALPTQMNIWRASEPDHPLAWIARAASKSQRPTAPDCWVIHGSPGWSQQNLERDQQDMAAVMLPLFSETVGCSVPDPFYIVAHRWRYAMVTTPVGELFLSDKTNTFFAGGDWCLGPRIEAAFLSGAAIADAIIRL